MRIWLFSHALFLSSNTQDFIEVASARTAPSTNTSFLSSNTQDFIEVRLTFTETMTPPIFLSSNTQDFIEVVFGWVDYDETHHIPEL